jgi:hypothetical protein
MRSPSPQRSLAVFPYADEGNYFHLKLMAEIISYSYNVKQHTGKVYLTAGCRQNHQLAAFNLFVRNDPLVRRIELFAGNQCYLIYSATEEDVRSAWQTSWVNSPQLVTT